MNRQEYGTPPNGDCLGSWLTPLVHSASPLNGEAAELWDKDPAEFKRKVLARHVELEDDEEEDEE